MEFSTTINSPLGPLKITVSNEAVLAIDFEAELSDNHSISPLLRETVVQLEEYFARKRKEFSLPLSPRGTLFQQKVWTALESIPYGETRSYKEMAIQLGDVKTIRAAASANGKNPIPIIIPCHRVIGSNGSLTGYSGGLDKKKWLLEFEQETKQPSLF